MEFQTHSKVLEQPSKSGRGVEMGSVKYVASWEEVELDFRNAGIQPSISKTFAERLGIKYDSLIQAKSHANNGGLSKSRVEKWIEVYKCAQNSTSNRLTHTQFNKMLNDNQVRKILAMDKNILMKDVTNRDISDALNIPHSTIGHALNSNPKSYKLKKSAAVKGIEYFKNAYMNKIEDRVTSHLTSEQFNKLLNDHKIRETIAEIKDVLPDNVTYWDIAVALDIPHGTLCNAFSPHYADISKNQVMKGLEYFERAGKSKLERLMQSKTTFRDTRNYFTSWEDVKSEFQRNGIKLVISEKFAQKIGVAISSLKRAKSDANNARLSKSQIEKWIARWNGNVHTRKRATGNWERLTANQFNKILDDNKVREILAANKGVPIANITNRDISDALNIPHSTIGHALRSTGKGIQIRKDRVVEAIEHFRNQYAHKTITPKHPSNISKFNELKMKNLSTTNVEKILEENNLIAQIISNELEKIKRNNDKIKQILINEQQEGNEILDKMRELLKS